MTDAGMLAKPTQVLKCNTQRWAVPVDGSGGCLEDSSQGASVPGRLLHLGGALIQHLGSSRD